MSESKKIRTSFSYPKEMKNELEKLAKKYQIRLMGYVKLIINEELALLRGGINNG